MKITFKFKDGNSVGGACPAFYEAPGGGVFQGKTLDAETRAQLRDLAVDEDAVFIPQNIIDRIRNGE
jgi:hypothetical protein